MGPRRIGWEFFTPEAQRAIVAAQLEAQGEERWSILPAHILLGALDPSVAPLLDAERRPIEPAPGIEVPETETSAARALLSLEVEPQLVRLAVQSGLRRIKRPWFVLGVPGLSRAAIYTLRFAQMESRRLHAPRIGTEHLLLGVAQTRWYTMPWYIRELRALVVFNLVYDATLLSIWRWTRNPHIVVAQVLHDYRLSIPTLREAALNQDPARARLPWTRAMHRASDHAHREARETGAGRVGAEHLLIGILADHSGAGRAALEATGLDVAVLEKYLRAALRADNETTGTKIQYTAEARDAFASAERIARTRRRSRVETDDLLIALASSPPATTTAQRLRKFLWPGNQSRALSAVASALRELGRDPDDLSRQLLLKASPPPSREEIALRVRTIVAEEWGVPLDEITLQTRLDQRERMPAVLDKCARDFVLQLSPPEARALRRVGQLVNTVFDRLESNSKRLGDLFGEPGTNWPMLGALLGPYVLWAAIAIGTVLSGEDNQLFGYRSLALYASCIPLITIGGIVLMSLIKSRPWKRVVGTFMVSAVVLFVMHGMLLSVFLP